ncbi:sortase domain-bontaining protein [Actinomadura atramentaria]|uniref:sortase domain-containing protein n=1 Tax=Actinomadura atramentaria TaxID=1990 RepID=UPI0003786D3A|nr:class F sortase [Actinomadura atramentaria]
MARRCPWGRAAARRTGRNRCAPPAPQPPPGCRFGRDAAPVPFPHETPYADHAPDAPGADRLRPIPLTGDLGDALPCTIAIPAIGVSAALAGVGRDAAGRVAAPPADEPGLAGWYAAGPTPGRPGAAVIVGNPLGSPGAGFARLGDLACGDIVGIVRADDTVAVFRVTGTERVPWDDFPESRVHGPVDGPELRLIAGAGRYDADARSHPARVIVYAAFTAAYRLTDLASL